MRKCRGVDGLKMDIARQGSLTAAAKLADRAPRSTLLWPQSLQAPRFSRLFGASIDNTSLAAAARDLAERAAAGRRTRVVFVNAHVVNEMSNDKAYAALVASADRAYADGSGMAIAARLAGQPLIDNVNGTDLFPVLAREMLARGRTIFLLGGREGVAAEAAATIARLGLGASIAGTHHGYFEPGSAGEAEAIAAVNASGADVVLVGMGVPVQDQWIAANAAQLTAPVLAGVGGLFDFFSGRVSRAPKAMRSAGLEWTWRLAMEPGRMAHRYLVGNVRFLGLASWQALAHRAGHGQAAAVIRPAFGDKR